MVFDARSGCLFILGGASSLSSEPPTTPVKCDFYVYSRTQGWTRLSSDTSVRTFRLKTKLSHSQPLQADVSLSISLLCVFSYFKFNREGLRPWLIIKWFWTLVPTLCLFLAGQYKVKLGRQDTLGCTNTISGA